ncbi:Macrolide export ATP-binding/permease protein MacB [Flagellimonas maritima]|uniref:Macrolide export ATP-binding/permease protein MacB n=1 Tax=Flagellimonas maritima TaxID=1383885 RepID=A0A2Z4LRI1_9FLAO|nr:ABC transporter permease [Allomuricauda aurantiaca]AWX44446.1 Macrolide export ATP-binding/permease protein MacB [Allomuricauda aurantiaca]
MLRNYIRIAWRNLLKRKVFTAINILGLAIGFGSSILIYLFLSYHLSFDNFHDNSDRIYRMVTEEMSDEIEYDASVPPAFAKTFREDYDYAEKVAKIVTRYGMVLDVEKNGKTNKFKEDVYFVEEDFFKIFNFPLLNNNNNVSLSAPNTAVITESGANKIYGTVDVIGKTFVLENDKTIEITGILKNIPETTFLENEVFISFENLVDFFEFAANESWGGITSNLECYALLKPNQDISSIENVLLELPKMHRPKSKNKHTYKLQPLSDMHFNPLYGGLDPVLLWVFAIIGLFLLTIACINFINISTAQAFYRSKEIGVRKVLGSFKQHLFWQFLSETFVISLFAILLGIGLAILFLPSLNSLFELELSWRSLLDYKFIGFLLLVLITVSFLSGSYPGILMSRIVPVLALKGKLNHNDTGGTKTRKVLVVAQFAISITLIAATLIISRQIDYAVNTDLGFDKESIVMVEIPADLENIKLNSLKERLAEIPGVKNVTACLGSPGAADSNWGTNVKYNNRSENEEFGIQVKVGDENYLNTFDIPLVAGRNFFRADTITEVLVNEKFGEKLGLASPEELLGKPFEANGGDVKGTIVGVVRNFHNASFTEQIEPVFIAPRTDWYGEIALKINHQSTNLTLEQIGHEWSQAFPGYIYEHHFLDERVAEQYQTEQRYLSLSKAFSGLAILVGCLGLYGLILFFVGQRTKEIGIRKVLGSNITNILALFSVDFFKLILVAGILATPIAWYLMEQWLQGYTYRTEIHWWFFAIAIVAIMVVTLITIGYQTLKVAVSSPVKSLRTE